MIPKPAKGASTRARKAHRKAQDARERANKAEARLRDGGCRWPRCGCQNRPWTEVAHLVAKSVGGSSETGNLIELCRARHQGTISLHSKRAAIVPLTEAGADGLCEFFINGMSVGIA